MTGGWRDVLAQPFQVEALLWKLHSGRALCVLLGVSAVGGDSHGALPAGGRHLAPGPSGRSSLVATLGRSCKHQTEK